jgi:hypothetical protein
LSTDTTRQWGDERRSSERHDCAATAVHPRDDARASKRKERIVKPGEEPRRGSYLEWFFREGAQAALASTLDTRTRRWRELRRLASHCLSREWFDTPAPPNRRADGLLARSQMLLL